MIQVKRVEALFHVRKLRGGSQPVLVQASDGFLYVVKFLNNPQGSNLLFNEALGTELFRGAGLPVPEWRLVHISEEFLDRNQACWMELEHGLLRPKAGWCFGSRFLNLRNTSVFEILSRTSFNRISNRRDFCTAWVLDALCGHADNRQAIFIERDTKSLEAFFIDHGHLFGGASGTASPSFLASRYLDSRVYTGARARDFKDIQRAIQRLDLAALSDVAGHLPEGWSTESALLNFERFRRRVTDAVLLKDAVLCVQRMVERTEGNHDRMLAGCTIELKCEDMYSQILPSRQDGRVDCGRADFAGGPGRLRPETVYPYLCKAAGF
ncbi:MAG: HipA family kinase [Terracidiphilus sp.]